MNKFLKFFFLLIASVLIVSCAKEDKNTAEPLRDYAEQYTKDIVAIDTYLDDHYMNVDVNYNVTFTKIPLNGTQQSIRQQSLYPVEFINVTNDFQNVNYKLYYIKLREGTQKKPSEVDSVHVAYRGNLLTDVQFDYSQNPLWFELQNVVPGWGEIIPKFKTGFYDATEGPDPVNFENYGAGIMFLPSAYGYYANSSPSGTIAAYSPLVFSFKLMELRYKDHDRDGILSKDEADPANPTKKLIDYDSDSASSNDGLANLYDVDDDDDKVLTRNEIVQYVDPITGKKHLYTFNGAATDNPTTPWDERQGIPRAFTGPVNSNGLKTPLPSDFTDPTRLRRHLDKNCKPPYL